MISVDLSRNVITFGGRSVAVSPSCAEVASCLASSFPHVASAEELIFGVYGDNEPLTADNIIGVFCVNLRKLVAPIGLGIATFKRRGRAFYVLSEGLPIGAEKCRVNAKPERNRRILTLRQQGLTTYEIAERINVSRNAVCGVLRRTKVTHNLGAPVA